ncbi:ferredoxin oxidoreductase [Ignisphaera sp. 4213-co]|uniref:2-oxoacid oxidoreductase (ferredoxin) n=1 Tax=Ignisphaera cupida TaxID=3050454 RepID=A0ABD4Z985_9CREN|nr:ferredoxin oxidoreductase [Ignisphaera sp. 4213-co]MDK6029473.1 ferredoxin oxidoreductase [Ignisphaera sp. 4213-co]
MEKELWIRIPLSSNYAAAYAAKDADVDVVAAYPITPQTPVVEKIAEFIANGELDAEMIHVESEHSALSACVGAAATGARTFTATSAQGLELMHEILHIASGLRLPIVMAIAARALSAPISIWGDYSDVMNVRDTSWIIMIASTAQEVYDSVIQAYKIAENPNVLLPAMVAYDGFIMSHTYEPVYVAQNRSIILDYIPKKKPVWNVLDVEKPITIGAVGNPDWYYEFKYQQVVAIENSFDVMREAFQEFEKRFGRKYGFIETYNLENSKIGVLTYGGLYGTVQEAVDYLKKTSGLNVAAIKLRVFRPFPQEELLKIIKNLEALIVIDRAISFGAPVEGTVALEAMSIAFKKGVDIPIHSYIASIGQRAVTEEDIVAIVKNSMNLLEKGVRITDKSIYWGVRA